MEKNLFKGIAPDIFGILFLIFAFMNNPFRFSDKPIVSKLTHSIASFTLVFMLIIMFVLIMYSKILTILKLNDMVSLSVPFFIILVFSLTILIIIYIHTDVSTAGICIKKEEETNYNCSKMETADECGKKEVCKWEKKFSAPPIYMLDGTYRIIIHLASLIITLINLYIFVGYFNKNNDVNFSFLNKMLTSDTKKNKAKPLIVSFFVVNILLHIIIIFQQLLFHPCKIDLPNTWNF
jgi:hypothetical protein